MRSVHAHWPPVVARRVQRGNGATRFGRIGALLNFVRTRGATDRFSRRDAAALAFVALAVMLNWKYLTVLSWVRGGL